MSEGDAASPLEAAGGAAGPAAVDAFKLLANETRFAILLALWAEYEPFEPADGLGFTELRERVGTTDSGQFNYHLDKLDGRFVESTAEGYRLREAGFEFVRAVIGGAGISDPTLEPTCVDMTCSICDGDVEVVSSGEWVYSVCTECDGLFTDEELDRGHLSKFKLPPAGFLDRSAAEIYAAAWVRAFQKLYSMIERVCPSCSGHVEQALEICEDHADDGICETCGRRVDIVAKMWCPICKEGAQTTIGGIVKYHPAAVAFHYEHDVPLQYGFNDLAHIRRRIETGSTDWELRSRDPRVVRITLSIGDDDMWLDIDDDLSVRGVSR